MAKRRNRKQVTRRRRTRSVGAAAGNVLMEVGGLALGAIAAKQLNKFLKFDSRILAGAKIALGVALPKFAKTPLMKSVGSGMIAVGATELVGAFVPGLAGADDVVLLSGMDEIGEIDLIGEMDEIGAMDISEVNGTDINEVNGMDEIGEIEMI